MMDPYSMMIKSTGLESDRDDFELFFLTVQWLLNLLFSFRFLICKVEDIMLTLHGCCKNSIK